MATPLGLGLATALATHHVFPVEGDGGVGKRVATLLGGATGPRHLHQNVVIYFIHQIEVSFFNFQLKSLIKIFNHIGVFH